LPPVNIKNVLSFSDLTNLRQHCLPSSSTFSTLHTQTLTSQHFVLPHSQPRSLPDFPVLSSHDRFIFFPVSPVKTRNCTALIQLIYLISL